MCLRRQHATRAPLALPDMPRRLEAENQASEGKKRGWHRHAPTITMCTRRANYGWEPCRLWAAWRAPLARRREWSPYSPSGSSRQSHTAYKSRKSSLRYRLRIRENVDRDPTCAERAKNLLMFKLQKVRIFHSADACEFIMRNLCSRIVNYSKAFLL